MKLKRKTQKMMQSEWWKCLWEDISELTGLGNNGYLAFKIKSNLDFYLHHSTRLTG